MPSACFAANGKLSTHWKHAKGMFLRYGVIVFGNLMRLFTKKIFYHQGFFAVKRRVVFILGAKWIALVRGWRRIVWLAAWKLFPMTQSAQSHRQMRSIPRCSKAVFYVFVFFDSIRDSATMPTLSPEIFHRTEIMPKGGSEIKRECIT